VGHAYKDSASTSLQHVAEVRMQLEVIKGLFHGHRTIIYKKRRAFQFLKELVPVEEIVKHLKA
jgi:hypothetical protein